MRSTKKANQYNQFSPASLGFESNSKASDARPFGSFQIGTGLDSAPSGYGSLYDSLFAGNPYRNLNYNKSTWQDFLSNLGFRTDADRFQEEAQMNALQWDAGVYQQMYQDMYNSETAKSERMREAGENPDLLGTGSVSDAASPVDDPQGMTPGSGEEGVLGGIVSTFISAFNTGVGMASQLLQLQGLQSDIEGKNIGNASRMMDVIQQRVLGMTPAEGFKTDKEFNDWKKKVEMSLRTNYGRSFFRARSLRRWNRSIDDFIGTLPTSRKQYDDWKSRLGSAKDYLRGRQSIWDESLDVFNALNEEIFGIQHDIEANSYVLKNTEVDRDIETATNDLTYQTRFEADLKGQAENAQNKAIAEGKSFNGILNEHLNKLGKRLDDFTKEGGFKGILSELLLILLTVKGQFTVDKGGNISGAVAGPQVQ